MATTLTSQVSSVSSARYLSSQGLSTQFSGSPVLDFERSFSSTECTKIYFASYSVTTSTTSIDLTSLTDAYGTVLSFSTVRHLAIVNNSGTNDITAGGGTNGLVSTLPVLKGFVPTTGENGTAINLTTNITVDSTHKILALTGSAGTSTVDVYILGA